MKNLIKILFLIALFSINLFSQSPEMPVVKSVSVNQATNKVEIVWSVNTTEQIDGYIIKRKIWGGTGVVDGTFNNVEIIEDSLIFSYTDISTEYSTSSDPTIRAEAYRVSSFFLRNDSIFYSIMSDVHKTIFAEVEYDVCNIQNNISWNTYQGWNVENYELYTKNSNNNNYSLLTTFSGNDSSYIHQNVLPNVTYTYYIKAISYQQNNEILTSLSNQTNIYTKSDEPPEIMNADFATVNQSNQIELEFTTENDDDVVKYKLLRTNSLTENFDTIAIFENNSQKITFVDTANIQTVHYYKLVAIDDCNNIFAESNIAQNIVLHTEIRNSNTERTNFLRWNKNNFWLGGVEKYNIYRSFNNSDFSLISTLSAFDSTYIDDIQEFIYSDEQSKTNIGKFCYYIEAIEGDANPYNIKSNCNSNVYCIFQEPICYIPNAFNPKSAIAENRIFKPKIIFCTNYYMAIYNRWGGKIFETNSLNSGWDGTNASGEILMPGSYTFFISFKNNNSQKIEKTGFIHLVY